MLSQTHYHGMKQHLALQGSILHLQLWSLGFVKHFTCHHCAIVKLKGKWQLSIRLGKLSIGKIVGNNANYPFVWESFQLAKL
jgi:hypothetical protein